MSIMHVILPALAYLSFTGQPQAAVQETGMKICNADEKSDILKKLVGDPRVLSELVKLFYGLSDQAHAIDMMTTSRFQEQCFAQQVIASCVPVYVLRIKCCIGSWKRAVSDPYLFVASKRSLRTFSRLILLFSKASAFNPSGQASCIFSGAVPRAAVRLNADLRAEGAKATRVKFDDLSLSAEGKLAMKQCYGYEYLTDVQAQTFESITGGSNLVVRAKTGAGKTLSFLLPTVERITHQPRDNNTPGAIDILILSPVRELSMQIYQEAEKLLSYYPGIQPVLLVGGTDSKEDSKLLESAGSILLVATPGRLQFHLNRTVGFADRMSRVQTLVLDEVDQLAGELFGQATRTIVKALSFPDRQSLFYSATMSEEVMHLVEQSTKKHMYVDMLQFERVSVPGQIIQSYRVVPTEDMALAVWKAIHVAKTQVESAPKIVVVFITGRVAAFHAQACLRSGFDLEVFEIHARLKQQKRTEQFEAFRNASSGILFTSDVTSRGLDYPGVTAVIQVGAPDSKNDYIHRVGRTGRGGNAGFGVLLLHDFERDFLTELQELPMIEANLDSTSTKLEVPDFSSMDIAKNVRAQAYYSRINHVMRHPGKLDALEVFREAMRFAASIGALDKQGRPPEITEENAIRYGVANLSDPALNIAVAPKISDVSVDYGFVPTGDMPRAVQSLLDVVRQRSVSNSKIVVFFSTGDVARYYTELFRSEVSMDVFEAHSSTSKKSLKQALWKFQKTASCLLFASGKPLANLPVEGVTDIIQIGAPTSVKDYEKLVQFASQCDRDIKVSMLLHAFESDVPSAIGSESLKQLDFAIGDQKLISTLQDKIKFDEKSMNKAYLSWLRYYASSSLLSGIQKLDIIKEAKVFAESIGALGPDGLPPSVTERQAAEMGLAGIDHVDFNVATKA